MRSERPSRPSSALVRRRRCCGAGCRRSTATRPAAVEEQAQPGRAARAVVGERDVVPTCPARSAARLDLDRVVGDDVVQAGGERAVGAQDDLVARLPLITPPDRVTSGPAAPGLLDADPEAERERLVALEDAKFYRLRCSCRPAAPAPRRPCPTRSSRADPRRLRAWRAPRRRPTFANARTGSGRFFGRRLRRRSASSDRPSASRSRTRRVERQVRDRGRAARRRAARAARRLASQRAKPRVVARRGRRARLRAARSRAAAPPAPRRLRRRARSPSGSARPSTGSGRSR